MSSEIREGYLRSFTSGCDILGDRTTCQFLASSSLFKHQHNLAAHPFDSASTLDDGWMRRLAACAFAFDGLDFVPA